MAETVTIRLTGEGFERVGAQFTGLGRRMGDTERRSRRLSRSLGRTARAGAAGLRSLGAAAAGVGAVVGGRAILNYQKQLAQLQIDSRMTAREFKSVTNAIAEAATIGVSNEQALVGLRVWQDFGGQLQRGANLLKVIAKVSQSTGTDMASLSTILATLTNDFKMNEDQAIATLAAFKRQGDAGKVALRQASTRLPQILGLGEGVGLTGESGARQLFGAFQLIAGRFGGGQEGAARGATALEALLSDLADAAKGRKIKKLGVDVFRGGKIRDLDQLIPEIIAKTGGSATALSRIFSREAMRGVDVFRNQEMATRLIRGTTGTQGDLEADFEKYRKLANEAQTAEVAIAKLRDSATKMGLQLAKFVAENPVQSLAIAVGGKVALSAIAGSIGPKGALVTGAFAAGAAIGRFADQTLGLSDRIANLFYTRTDQKMNAAVKRREIDLQSRGAQGASLIGLANQLTRLGLQGKTIETAPGRREELTPEVALRLIERRAEQMGSQDVFQEQVRLLRQVVSALGRAPRGARTDAPQNLGGRGQLQ